MSLNEESWDALWAVIELVHANDEAVDRLLELNAEADRQYDAGPTMHVGLEERQAANRAMWAAWRAHWADFPNWKDAGAWYDRHRELLPEGPQP